MKWCHCRYLQKSDELSALPAGNKKANVREAHTLSTLARCLFTVLNDVPFLTAFASSGLSVHWCRSAKTAQLPGAFTPQLPGQRREHSEKPASASSSDCSGFHNPESLSTKWPTRCSFLNRDDATMKLRAVTLAGGVQCVCSVFAGLGKPPCSSRQGFLKCF